MAQQMITLDEAAARLAISPEEMKKRLKTDPDFKKLSQIRDGSTVRFKVNAIDELARQLGMPTEDGSGLAVVGGADPGSDDFKVSGLEAPGKKPPADDALLDFGGSSTDDEVFSLADEPKKTGLSSGKLGKPRPPKSSPNLSDSSVSGPASGKLTPGRPPKSSPNLSDSSVGGSDSDVRLDGGKARRPKADEAAVPTEEIALDFSGGPGSAVIKGGASSAKLTAPKAGGSSGKLSPKGKGNKFPADVPPPDSSEFELSLDADSDDFDLQMNPEGGDEVDLGGLPKSAAPRSSASGINLASPKDSGVSLEKSKGKSGPAGGKSGPADASKGGKKKADESDASDADFELSLDSSAVASSTKLGAPKSGKLVLESDSDSEFELTLDDSHGSLEQAALGDAGSSGDKGDIFETDFEIPAMPDESGSEAVALESDTDLEKSDFELAMDDEAAAAESESEVVLLDDEAAPAKGRAKPARRKPAADDADVDLSDEATTDDEDASASKALKGARGRKVEEDEDEEVVPAGAAGPTKPWGIVPALFLAPSLLFCLAGALMGYELLQTMWGYQQPRKPTAPIVRGLASQFDLDIRDQ